MPAGSNAMVVGLVHVHPVDGIVTAGSVRWARTVRVAFVVSVLLVGYVVVYDVVVALSNSMYS